MPQPIPGSVWSRFEGDRLRDRHQTMFEDLGQRLSDALATAPVAGPGPAPPGPAFPDFETLMSPFRPSQAAAPATTTPRTPNSAESVIPASGGFALPSLDTLLSGFRPPAAAAATTTVSTTSPPGGAGTSAAGMPSAPAGEAQPFGPIVGGTKADFLRTAGPIAAQVEAETGIPARLSLAISANETGWGNPKHTPGGAYHGIQAQAGQPGTGYTDVTATGQPYQARLRSFESPYAAFRGFADFLQQNPRYRPALDAYQQHRDVNRLAADIKAAGYAEDPAYASKIQSIMAGIPEIPAPAARSTGPAVPRASVAPDVATNAVATPTGGVQPRLGTYTPETLTPNQFTEGQAQGLTTAEALAVCGPAAAVAFARANGRNPTLREAKELAQKLGLWSVDTGMYGPASQVKLLENMGIQSRLAEGTDWNAVRAEVQAGRPVIVDTPMHYYTVTQAYPDGSFEFGQSAGVLRKSGGKTRWRPEELPTLGMGSPRATIFMGGGR